MGMGLMAFIVGARAWGLGSTMVLVVIGIGAHGAPPPPIIG